MAKPLRHKPLPVIPELTSLAASKPLVAAPPTTPWWEWTIPTLNTRETSLVIWLGGGVLLLVAAKPDVRQSIGSVFKTFFGSLWLVGPFVAAAAYATGVVFLLRQFGEWPNELTKVAVVWFLGFGVISLFRTRDVDAGYYRRVALHALGLAVVVEFLSNLHTFPLPVELVLVPVALVLVGVQALAESDPQHAIIRKPVAICLTVIGLSALVYSVVYLVVHTSDAMSVEKTKAFLLPVVLTVAFLPFLVVMRFVVVYRTTLGMTRAGIDDPSLYAFARGRIVRACGLNIGKAQLFGSRFRGQLWGASAREDVDQCIESFNAAWVAGERVEVLADAEPT